jgi:BarA-like signal transduction histidine kinase
MIDFTKSVFCQIDKLPSHMFDILLVNVALATATTVAVIALVWILL